MATKAQIDAAAAILAAALDVKDANGVNVSLYNGKVVPDWNALAATFNAGLPALQAVGLSPAQAVLLLNQVVNGINPAGKELRRLSNLVAALVPSDVPIPTNLGRFPTQSAGSGLDYSGMCCDPNGVLYQFGGGHAASPDGDVRSNPGTAWASEYAPIPVIAMHAVDLDADKFFHTAGYTMQPIACHSYTGIVWSHAINKVIKMPGNGGPGYVGGIPEPGLSDLMQGGSIGHYDPVTKTWEIGGDNNTPPTPSTCAFCEDPVSLNILAVSQVFYGVYDPRTKKWLVRGTSAIPVTPSGAMFYWPDTDTFYAVAPNPVDGTGPQITAIKLNRMTWQSTSSPCASRRPDNVATTDKGQQYVYDPVNKIGVGCLDGDIMYGVKPDSSNPLVMHWFVQPAPGLGVVFNYHHAYDPKNKRHLIINGNHDTFAFVWNPALAVACDLPPPVTAPQTIDSFSAGVTSVVDGQPVTLSWHTTNATAVRLNGVSVAVSGSQVVTPTLTSFTYTLAAEGSASTLTSTVAITVTAKPPVDPPPPTNLGLVPCIADQAGSNQTNFGPADWIDTSKLPAPVPWTLYSDPVNKIFAPSQKGVLTRKFKKLTPWGTPPNLYGGLPRIAADGTYDRPDPQAGDDVLNGALPQLLKTNPSAGPRGKCMISPYITWIGHSRRTPTDDSDVLGTSRAPLYLGIRIDGMFQALMQDARGLVNMRFFEGLRGPLDWSFNPRPRDGKIFYIADTFNGRIVEINRHPGILDPLDATTEDFSKWVMTDYVTGLGTVPSCRMMSDGTMYICAYDQNALLKYVNGVLTKVLDVVHPFYIDYQSDGMLMLVTAESKVHRIDPANPNLDKQFMPSMYIGAGAINSNYWQLSVDRHGTIGPVDACYFIALHSRENCAVYRVVGDTFEQNWLPWGNGPMGMGPTDNCVDAPGHYPWACVVHPDQGLILLQGYASYLPALIAPIQPTDPPFEYDYTSAGWGWQVLRRGSGQDMPYGSVPSFDCQWDSHGWSLTGVTFDYIAQMSYADAAAFLRRGGFGIFPRTLNDTDCFAALYFIYRNSQRYLAEGKALIDGLRAHFGTLPDPPYIQLTPAGIQDDPWIDVVDRGGRLGIYLSSKYGEVRPAPDPTLQVRVLADEGTANARELGTIGLTDTLPALVGRHAYRGFAAGNATKTYWSHACIIVGA